MSFIYVCRHCKHAIGEVGQRTFSTSRLGLDQLTSIEKKDMIHYHENGDVYIQSICENCEESLNSHPHYHELDFFIQ